MIEFIRDQGQRDGEREEFFRDRAIAFTPERAFGSLASVIRKEGRLAWAQPAHPTADSKRHLHLVAKGK